MVSSNTSIVDTESIVIKDYVRARVSVILMTRMVAPALRSTCECLKTFYDGEEKKPTGLMLRSRRAMSA